MKILGLISYNLTFQGPLFYLLDQDSDFQFSGHNLVVVYKSF